jgi:ubiquinone/menaquinone biosynthesis C-methylase UbiE
MNPTVDHDEIRQSVRDAYGTIARDENSCCSGAGCCSISGTDPAALGYSTADLAAVPEGAELGLGCGNPVALASISRGEVILDLGSGAGFDCFLAASRAGDTGKVIGVDMTPDMITKARRNAAKSGFSNVEFRLGEIENLPVANDTADLILSNCVINLSPAKARVFAEAYRALKKGGRLAISDIVATTQMPDSVRRDIAAYAGCVAGATTASDIESMLRAAGFSDIKITPKEQSREFINEWIPGIKAGDFVVSATIEARK